MTEAYIRQAIVDRKWCIFIQTPCGRWHGLYGHDTSYKKAAKHARELGYKVVKGPIDYLEPDLEISE
jgi:hypothetical protein